MRRKKQRSTPPTGVLLAVAVAVAGAVVVLRRRSASGGSGGTATKSGPEPWTCQCGTAFRVSGTGRHAVFWLADADASDPVLDQNCPNCGEELPVTL